MPRLSRLLELGCRFIQTSLGHKMKKYIVICGNLLEGFRFHGTFDTNEEACEWGEKNFNYSGFFTAEIFTTED